MEATHGQWCRLLFSHFPPHLLTLAPLPYAVCGAGGAAEAAQPVVQWREGPCRPVNTGVCPLTLASVMECCCTWVTISKACRPVSTGACACCHSSGTATVFRFEPLARDHAGQSIHMWAASGCEAPCRPVRLGACRTLCGTVAVARPSLPGPLSGEGPGRRQLHPCGSSHVADDAGQAG